MVLRNILVLSVLGGSFFGCGNAEKVAQLQKQMEEQNQNLQNVQSQLELEKQKKLEEQRQVEEHRKIKLDLKASKDDKIFVREYTYRASEDDSKNSSRQKAITQLKVKLSEEVGTHIESYLSIDKKSLNGVSYKSINSEIKSISASITKLEILDEKWDGKNYWIKASVRVNEKQTSQLILEAIRAKANEKDVQRLNKVLAEQQRQLDLKNAEALKTSKKLVAQEIVNEARKKRLPK